MRIAVAGGTGMAGSLVVREARSRGHEVTVLTRANGIDVLEGSGLVDALADVDALVDATNTSSMRRGPALRWFEQVASNLVDAGTRAGVRHIVPLSIVGIDDVPLGYYAGKLAQEAVVRRGSVPWTIVRATQFFTFPVPFLAAAKAGIAAVPDLRCQPVSVEAVARLIVRILESPAQGAVVDIAGPRESSTVAMARDISRARGGPRVLSLPIPGAAGRAIRDGGLLPGPGAQIDDQDFAAWLDSTI